MPDIITTLVCFFFYAIAMLFDDNVCRFEQNYLDEYWESLDYQKGYVVKHPIASFCILALLGFISIFFVMSTTAMIIYIIIEIIIAIIGYFTIINRVFKPLTFEIVTLSITVVMTISLFLIYIL